MDLMENVRPRTKIVQVKSKSINFEQGINSAQTDKYRDYSQNYTYK